MGFFCESHMNVYWNPNSRPYLIRAFSLTSRAGANNLVAVIPVYMFVGGVYFPGACASKIGQQCPDAG